QVAQVPDHRIVAQHRVPPLQQVVGGQPAGGGADSAEHGQQGGADGHRCSWGRTVAAGRSAHRPIVASPHRPRRSSRCPPAGRPGAAPGRATRLGCRAAAAPARRAPPRPPSRPDRVQVPGSLPPPPPTDERSSLMSTGTPAPAHGPPTAHPAHSVRAALRSPRMLRTEVLGGLVVALALIPEAISFSLIAGVDPRVGLFASFTMAVTIAFTGGRRAMISAATGAVALVVAPLTR